MSYSSNVKQEITKKIPATNLECLAEISSIFENKSILAKDGIEIKMENSVLAKRVYSLIKATSSLKFGIKYSEILADIMKNTVQLEDVKLNININIGKNWAEAK